MRRILIALALVMLVLPIASACIVFPNLKGKNCNISFGSSSYLNETAIVNYLNDNKAKCNFTSEDITILKDFILNGYSVKEQTESEYDAFLGEAKKANEARPSNCSDYLAIAKKGKWTGYARSGTDYEHGECISYKCSGALLNIIWNSLLPIVKNNSSCKSLYWFDNEHQECGYKEFCGMYVYLGLQTFESKTQCEKALNENKKECSLDSDCPQEDCLDEEDCIGWSNICLNGKCYKDLSNGRKAEIKIMPETASQKAIERLGELNFTIQLKAVGKGNETKVVYELTGNKEGKFLGIFKIMARVQAQVDAEDGKVKVIKPWWSFLASGI